MAGADYLNSFLDPVAARLSRLASADALLSAASLGLALALFSLALIFLRAAFSPLVSAAGGAGIVSRSVKPVWQVRKRGDVSRGAECVGVGKEW